MDEEIEFKHGFVSDGVFYEDGSIEQDTLLSSPIKEGEVGTLLGYFKIMWQEKEKL